MGKRLKMKYILNKIFSNQPLSKKEAKKSLTKVVTADCNTTQATAFITAYCMRSLTVDELSGFRDALLELCHRIDFSEFNTIDLCGTGGDSKNTFNISTLTAFIVAAGGTKVAKHGNISVSSNSGSSDILSYFGYTFQTEEEKLKKSIEKTNFCYFHAPLFNPAMKNVANIRKELGMKTFFNIMGPLINPSKPKNQLIGVYNLSTLRLYYHLLLKGEQNFSIIHTYDGYDEVSLTTDTKIVSQNLDTVLSPNDFGSEKIQLHELYGGKNVKEAAEIFLKIIKGEGTKAQNNVVCANSALAFQIVNPKLSLADAVHKANELLISGQVYKTFKKAMAF